MGKKRSMEAPSPLQQNKVTSTLLVGALLFLVALAVSALYELDRSQREAQQRAAREIDSLARVFAEQTRRSLQTVDIMLRSVADAYRDRTLPPLDSREMHQELAGQRDQFSDVAAVFVTDSHGVRLNSSTAYPSPPGSVSGDDLLRALQGRSRVSWVCPYGGTRRTAPACSLPKGTAGIAFYSLVNTRRGRGLRQILLEIRACGTQSNI